MPDGAVYVGRPTGWGNPWRIRFIKAGRLGANYWMVQDDRRNWYPSSKAVAQRFAVFKFRRWLRDNDFAQRRLRIEQLRGKDLACWCRPGEPCHADVLIELANKPGPA